MTTSKESSAFVLTDRDYDVLSLLAMLGGLRALFISIALFPPSFTKGQLVPHSRCQKRLMLLHAHGYTERIEQPFIRSAGEPPLIHTLSKKGMQALAGNRGYDLSALRQRKLARGTTGMFLEHRMGINETYTMFQCACNHSQGGVSIQKWIDDAQLKRDHARYSMDLVWTNRRTEENMHTERKPRVEKNVMLIPDGYMHLHEPNSTKPDRYIAFEIDRGSEVGMSSREERKSWERTVRLYITFIQSGLYEQIYGVRGLRIVTVTTSEKRLANLKKITEEAGGKSRFFFTTYRQLVDTTTAMLREVHEEDRRLDSLAGKRRSNKDTREIKVPTTLFTRPIWQRASLEGEWALFHD